MKLRQIAENLIGQQLQSMFNSNRAYFARPGLQTSVAADAATGHDAGARNAGATSLPTGVPHKQRHRQFLGLEQRPGTLRL